uniref:Protein downstream neighbor of son homolog n=1 Tax=Strigamia maritima TaxID=126957 RepID=T1JCB0_STRMM
MEAPVKRTFSKWIDMFSKGQSVMDPALRSPTSSYPKGWKTPSDVAREMKLKKKKKRALESRMIQGKCQTNLKQKIDKIESNSQTARIQYNPFKKTCNNDRSESHPEIVDVFESEDNRRRVDEQSSQSSFTLYNILQTLTPTVDGQKKIIKDETIWLTKLPVDWSLKTKLRIISSVNFKWNSATLKTTEEASGTTGFVRCLNSDDNYRLDTSPSAELHQRCLIWIHPWLPWLKMFPRLTTKLSTVNTFCSSNAEIRKELYLDWCDSFRSLWQLLRSRQCAYFYFCAHSFTVLFRATGIAGLSEINALISPTSTGFRNALTEEGINFTQPLSKSNRLSSTDSGFGTDSECSQEIKSSSSQMAELDGTTNSDECGDVTTWLTSVGLEEKTVLTGTSVQRKLSQRKKRLTDSRPESMVYIEGIDVHALYNFLLNSNTICISNTGPLAGVPPTLISSVAFQGATLRPLKVKHEMVYQGKNKYHSLQLSGPILPHISHSLVKLMAGNNSEIQSYKIFMSTLDTTTPFSKLTNSQSFGAEFAKESLTDCGLHEELIQILCSSESSQVLNEISIAISKKRIWLYKFKGGNSNVYDVSRTTKASKKSSMWLLRPEVEGEAIANENELFEKFEKEWSGCKMSFRRARRKQRFVRQHSTRKNFEEDTMLRYNLSRAQTRAHLGPTIFDGELWSRTRDVKSTGETMTILTLADGSTVCRVIRVITMQIATGFSVAKASKGQRGHSRAAHGPGHSRAAHGPGPGHS